MMDYHKQNNKLVRNLHPLPRIGNNMQKLEGFQYDTILYPNMGYYIIMLSTASNYITTIVTELGKFRYNHLLVGMCDLGDILQAKLDKLISDIESIQIYIDDILVLIKENLSRHIDKLIVILSRLRNTGLQVNASK